MPWQNKKSDLNPANKSFAKCQAFFSLGDVWIDAHNPDEDECEDTGAACDTELDVYSQSTGTRLTLTWWDEFKTKEKGGSVHACLKYKYDSKKSESKLEDEDCTNSKPAACYTICSKTYYRMVFLPQRQTTKEQLLCW